MEHLPNFFQKLTNLVRVFINSSALTELPPSLTQLPNLKTLWIISSKFFTIPSLDQLDNIDIIFIGVKPFDQEIPIEFIPKYIPDHITQFCYYNYEIYPDINDYRSVNITKNNNKARIDVYKQLSRVLVIDREYRSKLKKINSTLSNILVCYLEEMPEWIKDMKTLQVLILVNVEPGTKIPDAILEIQSLQTVIYKDLTNVIMSKKVREFIAQKHFEWSVTEEISKKYGILSDEVL